MRLSILYRIWYIKTDMQVLIKEQVFPQETEVMIFKWTSAAVIAALQARRALSTRYNCATSTKIS